MHRARYVTEPFAKGLQSVVNDYKDVHLLVKLTTAGVVFGRPTKPRAVLCAQRMVGGNRKHWKEI